MEKYKYIGTEKLKLTCNGEKKILINGDIVEFTNNELKKIDLSNFMLIKKESKVKNNKGD